MSLLWKKSVFNKKFYASVIDLKFASLFLLNFLNTENLKVNLKYFFFFMLTITSYVGLLFAALAFTLGLYFGLTKVVKLI